MNKSVHTVLSPLLIINYVFGLRIVQLPISHLRLWFGPFCIPLLWVIYYFLRMCIITIYRNNYTAYLIIEWLYNFTTLLSILFGIYHNKQFRNCLKKLAIVDTTLEKLGIMTNYQQLRRQVIWTILGWSVIAILINNLQVIFIKKIFRWNTMTAICHIYVFNHGPHINLLADLTMMSIIRYVGAKFNQINEHLKKMANNNKYGTTQAWDNIVLHTPQRQFAKFPSNKWMIWIIIQLHLELRKISRELDSIYGVEMTFKMGCYFMFLAISFNNIFHTIFFRSYTNYTVLHITIPILWCSNDILKLLVINLMCEKVSNQANSTNDFLNKILQSMNNDETRENISQLLLHIKLSPLRFCGIGLFQFGHKFIYEVISSIGTVLVIIMQAHIQTENL